MASVVDICNRALDKLGQGPIVSLEDGTKSANLCNRNWPLIRDQVLRDHPWNFAVRRAILAPDVNEPVWGFNYKSPLPSNCLRLIEVDNLSTGEYQVEGRAILSNDEAIRIRFIARIADPNDYDSLFQDAVASRLAVELCESLTQSNSKKELLIQEYDMILTAARRVDGQENPPAVFEEDEWLLARF